MNWLDKDAHILTDLSHDSLCLRLHHALACRHLLRDCPTSPNRWGILPVLRNLHRFIHVILRHTRAPLQACLNPLSRQPDWPHNLSHAVLLSHTNPPFPYLGRQLSFRHSPFQTLSSRVHARIQLRPCLLNISHLQFSSRNRLPCPQQPLPHADSHPSPDLLPSRPPCHFPLSIPQILVFAMLCISTLKRSKIDWIHYSQPPPHFLPHLDTLMMTHKKSRLGRRTQISTHIHPLFHARTVCLPTRPQQRITKRHTPHHLRSIWEHRPVANRWKHRLF